MPPKVGAREWGGSGRDRRTALLVLGVVVHEPHARQVQRVVGDEPQVLGADVRVVKPRRAVVVGEEQRAVAVRKRVVVVRRGELDGEGDAAPPIADAGGREAAARAVLTDEPAETQLWAARQPRLEKN